ncbi:hypothetical protein [Curvibacter lanceolatus]|uniref:hypothetical protein n=1 Tax=Curvibacter lanceolatus TaxID=86182 RepID=UPI0003A0B30F|nr:hypothetical protein [Curvibacter lanceolatus]
MFLTFDGEPIAGRIPVQILASGDINEDQLNELRGHYGEFDRLSRLSIAPRQTRYVFLSDGSPVRLERFYGVDRIFVDPVLDEQSTNTNAPLAYPAYVDLAFAPIFDREVIDLGSISPYPPEPTYPTPAPYSVPEPVFVGTPGGESLGLLYYHVDSWDQIIPSDPPRWRSASVSLRNLNPYLVETGYDSGGFFYKKLNGKIIPSTDQNTFWRIVDTFESSDFYSLTTPYLLSRNVFFGWEGIDTATRDFYKRIFPDDGGTPIYSGPYNDVGRSEIYATLTAMKAADDASSLSISHANSVAYAAFIPVHLAWEADRAAYYAADYAAWHSTVYQAWLDACAAIDAAGGSGAAILKAWRTSGRGAQISSLTTWLDTGISKPHLVARYLSMPFNVKGAHAGTFSLPAGTDIGHDQITDATVNWQITHTVTNGNVNTVASETYSDLYAQTTMALPSGWKLGGNVAQPANIFGWLANGDYVRYKRFYPNHYLEPAQTRPGDLSTLTFSTATGYPAFVNSAIAGTSDTTARINSDAFLPPGTVITLIQLEYEVYDPFSLAWVWMPCVDLRKYDAIWLKSLGAYSVPAVPDPQSAGTSPRAVRVRRVLRTTRNTNWTWTAPSDVPASKMRSATFPSFALNSLWDNYPCTIVAATGLHPGAAPRVAQVGPFPFSEVTVFPEMVGEGLAALASKSWTSDPSVLNLTAKALNHVYKVAP